MTCTITWRLSPATIELYKGNGHPISEIPARNLQVSVCYSIVKKDSKDQFVMEAAKEKVLNIGATAKSGMDKTMATAEEKIEKMKTKDPLQKEMAEERKEEKIRQAELMKQQAYKENAILKGEAQHLGDGHQTGTGLDGHHTGGVPQTGLGELHTGVGDHVGLVEPTSGASRLHRTDGPVAGTETNRTAHESGGGLY